MGGLLNLNVGNFSLPTFLDKSKIVASSNDATINNRKYTASENVKRSSVNHSNDACIEKYNPLQNC